MLRDNLQLPAVGNTPIQWTFVVNNVACTMKSQAQSHIPCSRLGNVLHLRPKNQ